MTEEPGFKHRGQRWVLVALSILPNVTGAILTFIYFTFIESGLRPEGWSFDYRTSILFFLIIMGIVFAGTTVLGYKHRGSIWKNLGGYWKESDPDALRSVLSEFMNLPFRTAALTLLGWLSAGICYVLLPLFFQELAGRPWPSTIRLFAAIVFIGAPFSVVVVYFLMEWWVRREMQKLFPTHLLASVPKSVRINVLPKMLVVSLLIGIVPVSMVSYVTLSLIHEINAGHVSISSFLSNMPLVIGFLLSLGVLAAIRLSTLVAQSVSRPLRQVSSAMEQISKGDLNVSVAVVSNDEIGALAEGFNKMVEGLRERDFIRDTFGSYVSPDVASEILKAPDTLNLGGELREVTILVSDLRRFTSLSASVSAETVVRLLNRYFERMVDIIMMHGGTIDELMGDGVLAFFGAPRRVPESQLRAVHCAVTMQRAMSDLNRELKQTVPEVYFEAGDSVPPSGRRLTGQLQGDLTMGIGINSGPLVVGNIGSEKRKKYGAVGSPINVAFRVEKQTGEGEILITHEVYSRVAGVVEVVAVPDVELKGIDTPMTLYRVVELKGIGGMTPLSEV
ncbi:MAG TPA: adenylate/guanylate cyclase domain-containing protein [Desulfomonilaceae bacterium]|nr:adenylate/guanylate cyclase domain-containing protein [Desulfomonilaceae bacterium]